MNLVYDVNLKPTLCRLIADIFNDLANFIDTAIRRPIDFKNVDRVALGDLLAVRAPVARSGRRPFFAV